MSDFTVQSDSVDVEQIMRQIRARIREKRGVDYTEAELQHLAQVKLEKFIDPRGIRSDLLQHFQRRQAEAPLPNYEFGADSLFESHRPLLRAIRNFFRPFLKLFFNADRLSHALHLQSRINDEVVSRTRRVEDLAYELLHNLTVEVTRLGIEVHNLKMRVESLSARLDFDERRAKAFEGVVQYRTPGPRPAGDATPDGGAPAAGESTDDAGGERRRRRRRRRRRPGATLAETQGQTWTGEAPEGDEPAGDDDRTDQQDSPESGNGAAGNGNGEPGQ
ncbi:MAG: hypothetical protein DIU54_011930 [Acidobacteriota bacterium]|jgi:hypothetical protein|nr:MAG: hypothetical protein DIU54_00760 [Acidobacteriota bacterium]